MITYVVLPILLGLVPLVVACLPLRSPRVRASALIAVIVACGAAAFALGSLPPELLAMIFGPAVLVAAVRLVLLAVRVAQGRSSSTV